MAGDWIKVEAATPDKPEVIRLAELLKIDQDSAIGKLIRVWLWADQQTIDGNAPSVTKAFLDRCTFCSGFGDALESVGWLVPGADGGLTFPHFGYHNGETAKARALTAKRVARHKRKGNANGNANGNAAGVTSALPREEKRREEKSKGVNPLKPPASLPPELDFDDVRAALLTWFNHRQGMRGKGKLTPEALAGAIKKLAKMGRARAVAALEHSTSNGWLGIFEPQENHNGKPATHPHNDRSKYDAPGAGTW